MTDKNFYIVKFIRKDGKPDEEYYYMKIEDALYHYHLFENDTSNMYKDILLVTIQQ